MSYSPTRLESVLAEAVAAAGEAADLLRLAAGTPREALQVREKHPADYVTEVDCRLEDHFRRTLLPLVPGSAFLGEEGGLDGDPEGLLWVVDPLDGTTNFTRGLQPFGFSVALLEARVPILGLLGLPCEGVLLAAARGLGAWHQGCRLSLRARPLGSHTVAGTGRLRSAGVPGWFAPLAATGARLRFLGSTAAHLAGLALGRFDLVLQGFGRIWDVAGGLVVVEEAGGRMARLDGSALAPFGDEELAGAHCTFAAGPPRLLEEAMSLFQGLACGKSAPPAGERG